MKLLVDMNLSLGWAAAVQAAGIEAIHWSSVGPTNPRTRKSWLGRENEDSSSSLTISIPARSLRHPEQNRRA